MSHVESTKNGDYIIYLQHPGRLNPEPIGIELPKESLPARISEGEISTREAIQLITNYILTNSRSKTITQEEKKELASHLDSMLDKLASLDSSITKYMNERGEKMLKSLIGKIPENESFSRIKKTGTDNAFTLVCSDSFKEHPFRNEIVNTQKDSNGKLEDGKQYQVEIPAIPNLSYDDAEAKFTYKFVKRPEDDLDKEGNVPDEILLDIYLIPPNDPNPGSSEANKVYGFTFRNNQGIDGIPIRGGLKIDDILGHFYKNTGAEIDKRDYFHKAIVDAIKVSIGEKDNNGLRDFDISKDKRILCVALGSQKINEDPVLDSMVKEFANRAGVFKLAGYDVVDINDVIGRFREISGETLEAIGALIPCVSIEKGTEALLKLADELKQSGEKEIQVVTTWAAHGLSSGIEDMEPDSFHRILENTVSPILFVNISCYSGGIDLKALRNRINGDDRLQDRITIASLSNTGIYSSEGEFDIPHDRKEWVDGSPPGVIGFEVAMATKEVPGIKFHIGPNTVDPNTVGAAIFVGDCISRNFTYNDIAVLTDDGDVYE